MRTFNLNIMSVAEDGLPEDDVIRTGRILVGNNGALHQARVHRTMTNPFHPDTVVWQTADGQFLYNVQSYVELSERLPGHSMA